MNIKVDDELIEICKLIEKEKKADNEWALIESSDMYQTEHYCGGYEAIEKAFCFSYYNEDNKEFWFQINLNEVKEILNYKKRYISITPL